MRQKSGPAKQPGDVVVKDIRRATRRHFLAEEKIRVVLEGRRGEDSIAELCRREGIATSMDYGWSKEFLEAQVGAFVEHYNNARYHASLSHLTPADVYFGRGPILLRERER